MKNEHLWAIILAGGEGERTRPFVQRWLGFHRPKQYCRFVGTRSLFQHTLDRADLLSAPERRVTVIARSHQSEAREQLQGRGVGRLILQPRNCGTAPGVFLPLACIYATDPEATVVLHPSDHFVYPEEGLVRAIESAAVATERIPKKLIMLGSVPRSAEQDYGWIVPGEDCDRFFPRPVRTVQRFLEKPQPDKAQAALTEGGLWNTLILAAKAAVLWRLGWYLLPQMMVRFERLRRAIGTPRELEILEEIYEDMPAANLSTDILQHAPRELAVMELSGVYWSDWGRPERIAETLRGIGKQPLFPPEALLAS